MKKIMMIVMALIAIEASAQTSTDLPNDLAETYNLGPIDEWLETEGPFRRDISSAIGWLGKIYSQPNACNRIRRLASDRC